MKLLKKSLPIWAVLLIVVLVGSVAAALVWQFNYQISSTMRVRAYYTLEVWNEGKTELVTEIDWGDFAFGTSVETIVWIRNVGNVIVYPTWNVTSFPTTEFSITGYRWSGSEWTEFAEDTQGIFLEPDVEHNFMFKLTCIEETIADYGFVLNINGNDNT